MGKLPIDSEMAIRRMFGDEQVELIEGDCENLVAKGHSREKVEQVLRGWIKYWQGRKRDPFKV